MNCVLFARMDQVFSLKNKTLKNTGKMEKGTGKVREKSGNPGKLLILTTVKLMPVMYTLPCVVKNSQF